MSSDARGLGWAGARISVGALMVLVAALGGCHGAGDSSKHAAGSAGHVGPAGLRDAADSPYDSLMGQRYRTVVDLYLLRATVEPGFAYLSDGRIGAARIDGLGEGVLADDVGLTVEAGTMRVEALVPAGAVFTIDRATHEVLVASGQTVSLAGPLEFDGRREPFVLLELIQINRHARTMPDPDIDPRFARRVQR